MKDSKNLVIGLLCAVVCIMAVAYAAFSTTLQINGTATISSEWNVKITAIDCSVTPVAGGQTTTGDVQAATKSYSDTTAQFNMKFFQPGDTGTCTVTISNEGDLDAIVAGLNDDSKDGITVIATSGSDGKGAAAELAPETDPIRYSVSGIQEGTELPAGETNTYTINVEYADVKDASGNSVQLTAAQKAKTITVAIEYVQDLAA